MDIDHIGKDSIMLAEQIKNKYGDNKEEISFLLIFVSKILEVQHLVVQDMDNLKVVFQHDNKVH